MNLDIENSSKIDTIEKICPNKNLDKKIMNLLKKRSKSKTSIKKNYKIQKKSKYEIKIESNKSTEVSSKKNELQDTKKASKKKLSLKSKNCQYYMKDLLIALSGSKKPKYELFYEHFLQNSKFHYKASKLKKPNKVDLISKSVYLPPRMNHKKKTLILDLDETLIHSMFEKNKASDIKIAIHITKNSIVEISINIRPYALTFLEEMSKIFEVVIFSSSQQSYANAILNVMDPDNKFITFRIFRDNCVIAEDGSLIKDLRILANRDLKDIIIVDNSLLSYVWQCENAIPIIPFFDDKNDQELLKLGKFLEEEVNQLDDVRLELKRWFGIEQFETFSKRPDILSRKLLSFYS